jgi:class 3 adenylate cyclase
VTLLPAQVEIALAAGNVATARAAADELASLAERYGSLTIKASSAQAQGAVQLAEGDLAHAGETLRRAIQLWGELEAPHESARARLILAEAHLGGGDSERALLEGRAARAAFERLGAVVDLRRADELLATVHGTDAPTRRASADRAVKTFVFTDIAESTRLAELLGDEAWDRLIRWHDQTLRSLVAEHGGEEIKATGDGFFLAFDTTDQALACAIAIQRRLAEHSQAHGFAPRVRIGVHRAEANRSGLDYTGIGVNQAARIGESAVGGEILVSAPTLATARREHAAVGRRSVELRGLSVPVEVVSVDWR